MKARLAAIFLAVLAVLVLLVYVLHRPAPVIEGRARSNPPAGIELSPDLGVREAEPETGTVSVDAQRQEEPASLEESATPLEEEVTTREVMVVLWIHRFSDPPEDPAFETQIALELLPLLGAPLALVIRRGGEVVRRETLRARHWREFFGKVPGHVATLHLEAGPHTAELRWGEHTLRTQHLAADATELRFELEGAELSEQGASLQGQLIDLPEGPWECNLHLRGPLGATSLRIEEGDQLRGSPVPPGDWELVSGNPRLITEEDSRAELVVAPQWFTLGPRESRNLGELQTQQARSLTGVVLRTPAYSGAPHERGVLQLWSEGSGTRLLLHHVAVTLGEPFHLIGLAPRTYGLRVIAGTDQPEAPRAAESRVFVCDLTGGDRDGVVLDVELTVR